MAYPRLIPTFSEKGRGLQSGTSLQELSDLLGSTTLPVTALAGGGKTGAPVLNGSVITLGTVATGGDSVLLPPGFVGARVLIQNNGAASAQIFGSGTDTINGVATGTGVALANGAAAFYICVSKVPGGAAAWLRFVSA